MKKTRMLTFAALLSMVALTACNNDNPRGGKLDLNAHLYVNVINAENRAADEPVAVLPVDEVGEPIPTVREVVETALGYMLYHPYYKQEGTLGIVDPDRDVENNRIRMWREQVIKDNGELEEYFIVMRDIRLEGPKKDPKSKGPRIIAYIPNATMIKAEREIRAAYAAGDYDKVYKLFEEAYKAIPITTHQWKKLKESGEL